MRFAQLLTISSLIWPVSLQVPTRIYVYAQLETPARSWRPIYCDGIKVAKIRRGTFFAMNVAEGQHVLNQTGGVPLILDVIDGSQAFIRLDWETQNGGAAIPVLSKMHPDVANNEMRFVIYIDSKQILSPQVFKTDPRPTADTHLKHRGP